MIFNSLDFAIFLPIVFILYWFVVNRNLKLQNTFLAVVSYVFYGWWDWRFLFLIFFSSLVDYLVGIGLANKQSSVARKVLLSISICVNLGLLGFFKYYNFFIENFVAAFSLFGKPINVTSLDIILPVGISFYTFQTLSYSIDVYRRKLEPTKDFIVFSAFVSFFPQLVAGPIERATNLLPQFYTKRVFDYLKAVDALRQILWGLFKKIVIADNCAEYVNLIFSNSENYSGSTLVIGAFLFTMQIYGDFSGYSDMAIGIARLFGFDLMQNFKTPYFSRDMAEFWRRWHISLSTWFRDYLYIPLGGSRGNKWLQLRNIFIIFLVSGFWHGANWTFLAWGFLHAIYFLPLLLTNNNRNHLAIVAKGRNFPTLKEFFSILITFGLTVLSWIFFRAENITHAFNYIATIFSPSLFKIPYFENGTLVVDTLLMCFIMLIIEWMGREEEHALANLGLKWKRPVRHFMYCIIMLAIIWFQQSAKSEEFIYFQF